MWFLRFIKSNILYIIWFAIYFTIAWYLFGASWQSLFIVSIIYSISMTIALSPLGEEILKVVEGCRIPSTEQEKNYLLPIFEEVYQNAKEVNPSLNDKIEIFIMDALYVNAFAIGRKTVAVTRGAMETFTRDELKGILAHELGHMTYGHTKALLLSLIGNFLFTAIIFVLRLIVKVLEIISEIIAYVNYLGIIFRFLLFIVKIIFEISVFIFINAGELFLSINSRANEYQADKFAYDIGFSKQLIEAMYLLQKISINSKIPLSQKIRASHPHIALRISQLERLEKLAYE